MKRIIFSLALGLFATATFASCHRMMHTPQPAGNQTSATASAEPSYAASTSTSNAQGGGTRSVGRLPRFDGVTVSNGITLRYVPGGKPSIVVTTSRIDPSEVVVIVNDDDLTINYADHTAAHNEKAVVTITGYSIKDFELENGGVIDIAAPLRITGKLSLEVNNGGTIKLPGVKASELDVDVNNGGLVQLSNVNVSNLEMDVNNGGDIKVNGVRSGYADLEVSNGGNIDIVGSASTGKFEINNGGKIQADRLSTKRASIELNNGGTLHYNSQRVIKHEVFGGSARNHFK